MFEVDEWMICKPEHGEIDIVIVRYIYICIYIYICMYVYGLLHRCSGPSMCRIFAHEQQAQHVLANVAPIYHVVTPCIRLDVAPAEANRNYEPSKRRILSLDVQSVVLKNAARRVVPTKSGVEMELCRAKNLPKLSCSPPPILKATRNNSSNSQPHLACLALKRIVVRCCGVGKQNLRAWDSRQEIRRGLPATDALVVKRKRSSYKNLRFFM